MKPFRQFLACFLSLLFLLSLAACAQPESNTTSPSPSSAPPVVSDNTQGQTTEAPIFTPGTYQGTGNGNNGPIQVEVTFTKNEIADIQIGEHDETYYMCPIPMERIPADILEYQSLAVDTVAGATMTSNGILNAVKDCVEQAGGDPEALSIPREITPTDETIDCEVVVVGAGFSGLSASNKLLSLGVDVVLIEKLDICGGIALFSSGNMFGATSEEEYQNAYDVFMKETQNPMIEYPEEYPNLEKVEQLLKGSIETFRYINDELGIEMITTDAYAGTQASSTSSTKYMMVPTEEYADYSRRGSLITLTLVDKYTERGGELHTGTKAVELLTDASGAVTGVLAETRTGSLTINAQKVIMATGNISQNKEMLRQYFPERADDGDWFATSVGDTGEGIQMMLDLGAVMHSHWFNTGTVAHPYPYMVRTTVNGNVPEADNTSEALYVSSHGERKASESFRNLITVYLAAGETDGYFGIYDANLIESLGRTEEYDSLANENGPYYKADTLKELAEATGMDPDVFAATIARYNELCAAGEDADFGKDPSLLNPVEEGPFYAVWYTWVGYDLVGGVRTNLNCEVLKEDGSTIPNLYAVGFTSGRDFYGGAQPGAACLQIAATTGRIAAEKAAEALQ